MVSQKQAGGASNNDNSIHHQSIVNVVPKNSGVFYQFLHTLIPLQISLHMSAAEIPLFYIFATASARNFLHLWSCPRRRGAATQLRSSCRAVIPSTDSVQNQ